MQLDLKKLKTKENQIPTPKESPRQAVNDAAQLGVFIRRCRKASKTTQEEVATFANVSRLKIGEIENGKGDVKLSTLLTVLKACSLALEVVKK
jgi:DNA-binding XRE family transcriptional regulator